MRRLGEVCAEVVVAIALDAPGPDLPLDVGARVVRDRAADEGPLAGLLAGAAAASSELAIVAGGDMPELSAEVCRELLRVADATGADAVALADGDRFRPLPAVLRVEPALVVGRRRSAAGERSLRGLLEELGVLVVGEAAWTALDPGRRTLFDVDEPGDLSAPPPVPGGA